jgi:hypothetical protein
MQYLPNIEASAFRRGEYVGYDCQGECYRIKKSGSGNAWWIYPQTPNGIPVFYAPTLAVASIRLQRRDATCALVRLPHEH